MLKIKKLKLKNYSGFKEETSFSFTRKDGTFKPINVFYGPNGCGKSTGLDAISILCKAKQYVNREPGSTNLLLRKMKFHPDYDPTYVSFAKYQEYMEMHGEFCSRSKNQSTSEDLSVSIIDDDVVRNDLELRGYDNCVYINADHPMNMKKFQIPHDRHELFLDLANAIYGYPCSLSKLVNANGIEGSNESLAKCLASYANNREKISTSSTSLSSNQIYDIMTESISNKNDLFFYQDFIIQKGNVKVHHKSMSDGEKKIATVLRNLCDPSVIDKSDIVLIDNIEMHIYFKRHEKMVDKLLQSFPDKQFIVTTHSGILINHVRENYGADCLYDISEIKGQSIQE